LRWTRWKMRTWRSWTCAKTPLIHMNWTRIPHIPSMITCRNDPSDNCATDHESVGERLADTMRHNDLTCR
jgi:hypothetical protein